MLSHAWVCDKSLRHKHCVGTNRCTNFDTMPTCKTRCYDWTEGTGTYSHFGPRPQRLCKSTSQNNSGCEVLQRVYRPAGRSHMLKMRICVITAAETRTARWGPGEAPDFWASSQDQLVWQDLRAPPTACRAELCSFAGDSSTSTSWHWAPCVQVLRSLWIFTLVTQSPGGSGAIGGIGRFVSPKARPEMSGSEPLGGSICHWSRRLMSTCSLTITSGSSIRGETRIVSWGDTIRVQVRAAHCEPALGCRVNLAEATTHSIAKCSVFVLVDAKSVWNDEVRLVCRGLEGVLVEEESAPPASSRCPAIWKRCNTVDSWREVASFWQSHNAGGLATWLAVAPGVPSLATRVLRLAPGFHETTSEVAPFFPTPSRWGSKVEVLIVCSCANKGGIARKECSKSESTVRPRFGCVHRAGEGSWLWTCPLCYHRVESATEWGWSSEDVARATAPKFNTGFRRMGGGLTGENRRTYKVFFRHPVTYGTEGASMGCGSQHLSLPASVQCGTAPWTPAAAGAAAWYRRPHGRLLVGVKVVDFHVTWPQVAAVKSARGSTVTIGATGGCVPFSHHWFAMRWRVVASHILTIFHLAWKAKCGATGLATNRLERANTRHSLGQGWGPRTSTQACPPFQGETVRICCTSEIRRKACDESLHSPKRTSQRKQTRRVASGLDTCAGTRFDCTAHQPSGQNKEGTHWEKKTVAEVSWFFHNCVKKVRRSHLARTLSKEMKPLAPKMER